jgi:hypothetical protein
MLLQLFLLCFIFLPLFVLHVCIVSFVPHHLTTVLHFLYYTVLLHSIVPARDSTVFCASTASLYGISQALIL